MRSFAFAACLLISAICWFKFAAQDWYHRAVLHEDATDMPNVYTELNPDRRFADLMVTMEQRIQQVERGFTDADPLANAPPGQVAFDSTTGNVVRKGATAADDRVLYSGSSSPWNTLYTTLVLDKDLVLWTQANPGTISATTVLRWDEATNIAMAPSDGDHVVTLGTGTLIIAGRPVHILNEGPNLVTFQSQQFPPVSAEQFENIGGESPQITIDDVTLLPGDDIVVHGYGGGLLGGEWRMVHDGRRTVHAIDDTDSPFAVTAGFERIVRADTTSGNVTVTLPLIRSMRQYGSVLVIKTAAANSITVNAHATDSGATVERPTLSAQWASFRYYTDGTDWIFTGN